MTDARHTGSIRVTPTHLPTYLLTRLPTRLLAYLPTCLPTYLLTLTYLLIPFSNSDIPLGTLTL